MKMLVRAVGLLIGGWIAAWPGFASASGIAVLDGLGLPVHMAEVHGRVLSALEAAATRSGRTVVKAMGPAPTSPSAPPPSPSTTTHVPSIHGRR